MGGGRGGATSRNIESARVGCLDLHPRCGSRDSSHVGELRQGAIADIPQDMVPAACIVDRRRGDTGRSLLSLRVLTCGRAEVLG